MSRLFLLFDVNTIWVFQFELFDKNRRKTHTRTGEANKKHIKRSRLGGKYVSRVLWALPRMFCFPFCFGSLLVLFQTRSDRNFIVQKSLGYLITSTHTHSIRYLSLSVFLIPIFWCHACTTSGVSLSPPLSLACAVCQQMYGTQKTERRLFAQFNQQPRIRNDNSICECWPKWIGRPVQKRNTRTFSQSDFSFSAPEIGESRQRYQLFAQVSRLVYSIRYRVSVQFRLLNTPNVKRILSTLVRELASLRQFIRSTRYYFQLTRRVLCVCYCDASPSITETFRSHSLIDRVWLKLGFGCCCCCCCRAPRYSIYSGIAFINTTRSRTHSFFCNEQCISSYGLLEPKIRSSKENRHTVCDSGVRVCVQMSKSSSFSFFPLYFGRLCDLSRSRVYCARTQVRAHTTVWCTDNSTSKRTLQLTFMAGSRLPMKFTFFSDEISYAYLDSLWNFWVPFLFDCAIQMCKAQRSQISERNFP